MQLREYIRENPGAGIRLARALGISQSYLSQMAAGNRPIPVEACVQLEALTDGHVLRWDCRPGNWHLIWPELRQRGDAPPLPTPTEAASQTEERAA